MTSNLVLPSVRRSLISFGLAPAILLFVPSVTRAEHASPSATSSAGSPVVVEAGTEEGRIAPNAVALETAALETAALETTDSPPTVRADEDAESVSPAAVVDKEAAIRADLFEFHGYVRTGFGSNGKGGDQDAFLAPGTGVAGGPPVKYRLGNETETYGELILVNNWLTPQENSASLKTEIMLVFLTANNANFDPNDVFTIREAFVQAGNVIVAAPEAKFWAGQRYYRRHDIHINDFWVYDMSGYGGGVEDVSIGLGKLAFAYLGGSTDDDVTSIGRPVKHTLDLRLYELPAPGGSLTLAFNASRIPGGDLRKLSGEQVSAGQFPDVDGWSGAVFHISDPFLGGSNKLSFQYGAGASSDFHTFYHPPSTKLTGEPGTQVVDKSWRARVTETAHIQPTSQFSLMGTLIYQLTETGAPGRSKLSWYSGGVRPIWHATEYLSLAAEAGVDYIKDQRNQRTGYLAKYTLAPQVASGSTFWSRPVVRAYLTYAHWSNEFRGFIGGDAHNNDNRGLAFGVQMEAWW